ncbi:MAG: Kae1-associated serine/threonine protein kinase [Nanoarchaeota archaeon]|nr:Kae1-associated serine/threonine protein kinase [Nanoarchaeota archaeon]
MKTISQGAEAIIYLNKEKIIKDRISKKYRHPEIDKKIIKRRTKAETKILDKVSEIISAPKPEKSKEDNKIVMPYINGKRLSQSLDSFPLEKQKEIMKLIGISVSKLHKEGIIHGDLTTSNMILIEKPKLEVYFIDFGLGYQNGKYEDKGVDIHLLKQALEAKHFKNWKTLFKEFEKAYKKLEPTESKKVFERLKSIEKRGRYRH